MKSVLFVNYYYPPDAAIGGKRIARFCKYLSEFGIRPVVLTVDLNSCASLDYSFRPGDTTKVYRVAPHLTPLAWYARKSFLRKRNSAGERVSNHPIQGEQSAWRGVRFGAAGRNIVGCLSIPDVYWGWYLPATRAGVKIVKEEGIDAVVSSGPPWTTHAVGRTIARKCGIPWVADYRDGWNWSAAESTASVAWRNRLDLWLEASWLQSAELVICNTARAKKLFLDVHCKMNPNRTIAITNGFDGIVAEPKGRSSDRSLTLLHAGSLYGDRNVSSFLKGFQLLLESGRMGSATIRVVFLGSVTAQVKEEALVSTPSLFEREMVKFEPAVDSKTAQELMKSADVLLTLLGDHNCAWTGTVPAKFYEYLATGKPILTVVQEGALRDICVQTNCGPVVDPSASPEEMARAIEEALHREPRSSEEIAQVAAPYHFRNLTAKLAEHLHCILDAGVPCVAPPDSR